MPVKTLIKPSQYYDSVTLMQVAQELTHLAGVTDASVVMATEANKGILKNAELLTPEAAAASSNDLVIAVKGDVSILEKALGEAENLLTRRQAVSDTSEYRPKTLRAAIKADHSANIAVISVAGRFAADEAWEALHHGLHVLLFSDNVSLDDEIALKTYASEHGLLLMGPGAGTAMINGVALGFADVVQPGPVGIVSAAGTGLQEVSTLLAKWGVGITQGIGTGGRDLKSEVGGLMMLAGLRALQDDPETRVIILISKPPASTVAQLVLEQVNHSEKPTIVCFLGGNFETYAQPGRVIIARTLEDAARYGVQAANQTVGGLPDQQIDPQLVADLLLHLHPEQQYLRGLYSGGTLCYEAQVIWRDWLPIPVFSNAPLHDDQRLADSTKSYQHTAVDLGEEEFTVGRPHPMIDNDLRIRRLLQEARDPTVAIILLDVVLGFGAHPDPAAELGPALRQAQALVAERQRELIFITSITGTEQDPQCLSRQKQALEAAGAIVCESNAAAARLAAAIIKPLHR